MSDDPSPYSKSAQPLRPPPPNHGAEEPATEIPRFLRPKSRYRRSDDEEAIDEVDEVALLSSALELARRRKQNGEPARPAANSINRFMPAAEGAADDRPEADGRPPDAKTAASLPKFKASPADRRWRTVGQRRSGKWGWIILGLAGAAGLVLLGFAAGRSDVVSRVSAGGLSKASEAAAASPWLEKYSGQLRKAHAAERAGDLFAALQLLNDLAKTTPLDPLVQAYRGSINSRLGYFNDAESDLSRAVRATSPPGVVATIEAARAFNFVRWRRFPFAILSFQAVALVDPSNVPNLVNWAETLRRAGSLSEAVEKFSDALAQVNLNATAYAQPQREYIAFLRRLSIIEAGRGAELQAEIDGRLADPAPSGYWVLTAAAQDLQKGDAASAVEALKKAHSVLAPEHFRALLEDYFFRSFSQHSELDSFLYTAPPEQHKARLMSMDYFVDP